MATFIHNEPTSLSILQEAKIPSAFLDSIKDEIPASVDVGVLEKHSFIHFNHGQGH
jgi:hypothetical protein